ncbi:MAG: tyrosine-type recombinase/integrase [Thermoplasmata archaeon]
MKIPSLSQEKDRKKREIYLPPQTKKAIDDYVKIRLPTDVNYLFTSPEGRVTYSYMRKIISEISKKAGVHFHAHMARHTYATTLLKAGVSPESVRKLLGHESLSTTQIYLHLDQSDAINEVRRRFPKFFLSEGSDIKGTNPCAPSTVLYAPVGI